jgi:hypothetical protein
MYSIYKLMKLKQVGRGRGKNWRTAAARVRLNIILGSLKNRKQESIELLIEGQAFSPYDLMI